MPRSLRQIERELREAEALSKAESLAPSRDNEGNIVITAEKLREVYARRAVRLRAEYENLDRIVNKESK